MTTIRRARRQLNNYQLSIICPALSLKLTRREIRTVLMDCGLKASQWDEELLCADPADFGAPAPWMVTVEFKSQSENCMHFLQLIVTRLTPLPLVRVRLDCLPPPTALPLQASWAGAPG